VNSRGRHPSWFLWSFQARWRCRSRGDHREFQSVSGENGHRVNLPALKYVDNGLTRLLFTHMATHTQRERSIETNNCSLFQHEPSLLVTVTESSSRGKIRSFPISRGTKGLHSHSGMSFPVRTGPRGSADSFHVNGITRSGFLGLERSRRCRWTAPYQYPRRGGAPCTLKRGRAG